MSRKATSSRPTSFARWLAPDAPCPRRMRAAAIRVEIHLPMPQSLKAKRAVLRPVLEGMRRLGSYSVAEVGHQNDWQRATLGVAVVARDGASLDAYVTSLRRYLDGCLEIDVLEFLQEEMEVPE